MKVTNKMLNFNLYKPVLTVILSHACILFEDEYIKIPNKNFWYNPQIYFYNHDIEITKEIIQKYKDIYKEYIKPKNYEVINHHSRSLSINDCYSLVYDFSEEELFYLKLTGLFPNLKVDETND